MLRQIWWKIKPCTLIKNCSAYACPKRLSCYLKCVRYEIFNYFTGGACWIHICFSQLVLWWYFYRIFTDRFNFVWESERGSIEIWHENCSHLLNAISLPIAFINEPTNISTSAEYFQFNVFCIFYSNFRWMMWQMHAPATCTENTFGCWKTNIAIQKQFWKW